MAAVGQQPRPLRGSRISTFYPVKSLPSLASLDSAFQLQEYISLLIRLDVHDVDVITALPGAPAPDAADEQDPKDTAGAVAVDEACWIYEQLRRLAQDLTHPLITTLQQECSRSSCPEMKAGEWLYLCVAHGNDNPTEQCCAIDYILHTLDSATALLNSPRAFPSRLQIPVASHRHFSSLARRLGRIFAHAYFHHREAFEQAEAESSLYARFLALTSKFDLVPSEFLVIPPSAAPPTGSSSSSTGAGDDDEFDEHARGAYGLREAKLGTSYDPRRAMGQQQHREAVDEFSRARHHPQQQQQQQYYEGSHFHGGAGSVSPSGIDSPRKVGRNRTDTMVHSELASVVDELAKNAAAATPTPVVKDEEENEKEEREREGRQREKAEAEERDKVEAEARARAEAREDEANEEAEEEAEPDQEQEQDQDQDHEQEQEHMEDDDEADGDDQISEDPDHSDHAPPIEPPSVEEDEHEHSTTEESNQENDEPSAAAAAEPAVDTDDFVDVVAATEEEEVEESEPQITIAPVEEPVDEEQEKVECEGDEEDEAEEVETGTVEAEAEAEEPEKPTPLVEEKGDEGDSSPQSG